MDIVDAQFHLFMTMDAEAGLCAMDALGIRSVLIDELWGATSARMDPDGSMPGLRLPGGQWRATSPGGQMASLRWPERYGFQLRLYPNDPDLESVMTEIARAPGHRAFRYDSRDAHERDAAAAGDRMDLFRIAQRLGRPISVTGRIPDFEQYFRAFPDLLFLLDHCGVPRSEADFEHILGLARYPNLRLKWSHAPRILHGGAYPFQPARDKLYRAIDAWGRDRIMWGSDFTAIPMVCANFGGEPYSWAEALFYIRDDPHLSAEDKAWLLGRTARQVYDWPATAPQSA
ncbi:amidohydrolase family protein [Novosphingobium bradum]|uniref:Amidohydrolase family protein n=1 Tax=Novosphingobium bradum TaxID=1737444 RepID=A0ABV7IR36_9SPHN